MVIRAARDPLTCSVVWLDDDVAEVVLNQNRPVRLQHKFINIAIGLLLKDWGVAGYHTCWTQLQNRRETLGEAKEYVVPAMAYDLTNGKRAANKLLKEAREQGAEYAQVCR